MVPGDFHDFFVASASASGALIGLLFVALTVQRGDKEGSARTEALSLRAAAAFTVFSNALVVSLFALIPSQTLGQTASAVSAIGIVFVIASALRILRLDRDGVIVRPRDLIFLLGATALFAWQMSSGVRLWIEPHRPGLVSELAVAVIICFAFGIARAWELIGGPQFGVVSEVDKLLRQSPGGREAGDGDDSSPPSRTADRAPAGGDLDIN